MSEPRAVDGDLDVAVGSAAGEAPEKPAEVAPREAPEKPAEVAPREAPEKPAEVAPREAPEKPAEVAPREAPEKPAEVAPREAPEKPAEVAPREAPEKPAEVAPREAPEKPAEVAPREAPEKPAEVAPREAPEKPAEVAPREAPEAPRSGGTEAAGAPRPAPTRAPGPRAGSPGQATGPDPGTRPEGGSPGQATGPDPGTRPEGGSPGQATGPDPGTRPEGGSPGQATGPDPGTRPDDDASTTDASAAQDPGTGSGDGDLSADDASIASVRGGPAGPVIDEGIIVVDTSRQPPVGFGDIRPGETISITGIDERFSGNGFVTGERHDLDGSNWAGGDEIFGSWSTTDQPGVAGSGATAITGDIASTAGLSGGKGPGMISGSEDEDLEDLEVQRRTVRGGDVAATTGSAGGAGGDFVDSGPGDPRTIGLAGLDIASTAGLSGGKGPGMISGSEDEDLEDLEVQRRTVRGGDVAATTGSAGGAGGDFVDSGPGDPRTIGLAGLDIASTAGLSGGKGPGMISGSEDEDLEDLEVQRRTVRGGDVAATTGSAGGAGGDFVDSGPGDPRTIGLAGSGTDEGIIVVDTGRQDPRTIGLAGSGIAGDAAGAQAPAGQQVGTAAGGTLGAVGAVGAARAAGTTGGGAGGTDDPATGSSSFAMTADEQETTTSDTASDESPAASDTASDDPQTAAGSVAQATDDAGTPPDRDAPALDRSFAGLDARLDASSAFEDWSARAVDPAFGMAGGLGSLPDPGAGLDGLAGGTPSRPDLGISRDLGSPIGGGTSSDAAISQIAQAARDTGPDVGETGGMSQYASGIGLQAAFTAVDKALGTGFGAAAGENSAGGIKAGDNLDGRGGGFGGDTDPAGFSGVYGANTTITALTDGGLATRTTTTETFGPNTNPGAMPGTTPDGVNNPTSWTNESSTVTREDGTTSTTSTRTETYNWGTQETNTTTNSDGSVNSTTVRTENVEGGTSTTTSQMQTYPSGENVVTATVETRDADGNVTGTETTTNTYDANGDLVSSTTTTNGEDTTDDTDSGDDTTDDTDSGDDTTDDTDDTVLTTGEDVPMDAHTRAALALLGVPGVTIDRPETAGPDYGQGDPGDGSGGAPSGEPAADGAKPEPRTTGDVGPITQDPGDRPPTAGPEFGSGDPGVDPYAMGDFSASIMGGVDAPAETAGTLAAPAVSVDVAAVDHATVAPAVMEAELPPVESAEMKFGPVAQDDAAADDFDLSVQGAELELAPVAVEAHKEQPGLELPDAGLSAPEPPPDAPGMEEMDIPLP